MNKEQLLSDYLNGMVSKELVKTYKTSLKTLQSILADMGYLYKDARYRLPTYNSKAFSNWEEEESAYFYGFILGDGCLHEKKNTKSIVMGLNTKDIDILEKLKAYLGSRNKISSRVAVGCAVSQFSFSDKEIIDRLIKLGLTPRKSTREVIPKNLENNPHFWRGLVDADGSLSTAATDAKRTFSLSLVGSKETAEKFKLFCDTAINSSAKIRLDKNSLNLYYCTITGQDARKLVKLLYKGAKVFLNRKYQVAMDVQKDYEFLNLKRSDAQPLPTIDGRWTMQVGDKRKTIRLGVFDTQEEAIKARDAFVDEFNRSKRGVYINSTGQTRGC